MTPIREQARQAMRDAWNTTTQPADAVMVAVLRVAEHRRAERVEKALLASQTALRDAFLECSGDLVKLAKQGATLAEQDVRLEAAIRAVAALSTPPAVPAGQVHIVVPGPRTLQ